MKSITAAVLESALEEEMTDHLGHAKHQAPTGGAATAWAQSPLLTTAGVPPFGANGLAFNRSHTVLFVANTGNDTIVKIPVATRTAEVFTNSINGADGLLRRFLSVEGTRLLLRRSPAQLLFCQGLLTPGSIESALRIRSA